MKVLQFPCNLPYHKPSRALLGGQGRLLLAFPSSCCLWGSSNRNKVCVWAHKDFTWTFLEKENHWCKIPTHNISCGPCEFSTFTASIASVHRSFLDTWHHYCWLKRKVYKGFSGGKHLKILLKPGKEKSETNKTSSFIEEPSLMVNYRVTYLFPGKTFS